MTENLNLKKFVIVSSHDPNGVTIILNILLELGIRIERDFGASIWEENNHGNFILKPNQSDLRKWLPALTKYQNFDFDDRYVVYWSHCHSFEYSENDIRIILMVRDPRDALFSSNRRYRPDLKFKTYLMSLDPLLFQNRIKSWKIFYENWLTKKDFLLKFEEVKLDGIHQINNLLDFMQIKKTRAAIIEAIGESTFKKAQEVESHLRILGEIDSYKVNFAGQVNEWLGAKERLTESNLIRNSLIGILRYLKYETVDKNSYTQDDFLQKNFDVCDYEATIKALKIDLNNLWTLKNLRLNLKNAGRSYVDHKNKETYLERLIQITEISCQEEFNWRGRFIYKLTKIIVKKNQIQN